MAKSDNSPLSMKMKLTGTDRSHPFPLSLLAGVDLESINSSSKSTSPSSVSSERLSMFGEDPLAVDGLPLFFATLPGVSGTSEESSSILCFSTLSSFYTTNSNIPSQKI